MRFVNHFVNGDRAFLQPFRQHFRHFGTAPLVKKFVILGPRLSSKISSQNFVILGPHLWSKISSFWDRAFRHKIRQNFVKNFVNFFTDFRHLRPQAGLKAWRPGAYSLGAYSLGAYSLRAYNLGAYSLRTYSLDRSWTKKNNKKI